MIETRTKHKSHCSKRKKRSQAQPDARSDPFRAAAEKDLSAKKVTGMQSEERVGLPWLSCIAKLTLAHPARTSLSHHFNLL